MIDATIWKFLKHFPSVFDDDMYCSSVVHFIHEQLATSVADTSVIALRVETIRTYRKQLATLMAMPQVAQRSEAWYEMRRGRLTASAIDQALDRGKYGSKADLLKSKAFPEYNKPFNSMGSPPLRHGIILEDMSARCYSQRLDNISIHDFGMIPHHTMSCFGASPDGINELGIMVEIKTPYRRRVDGTILEGYMLQMQGQMDTCMLPECDFVDACIKMDYRGVDSYVRDTDPSATVDHGIIVEYMVDGANTFDYSPAYMTPQECIAWGETQAKFRNTTLPLLPWKLLKILITRVKLDHVLWKDVSEKIERFWEEVLALRASGFESLGGADKSKVKKDTKQKEAKAPSKSFKFIDSDSDSDSM
jgi:putative phage-type endonuclease